ncbi:uncharacterized protein LOC111089581 [Limulus polyphemus]|uniref:Uncharacterized protein LOC111089581 n=1 Tax=Limulus polyphemus TaxID=6850 RepID=A0ABM1TQA8_LIMPO|nr:uncharacterized protein LOC111089581 [Limulus polyphemus]
MKIWQMTTHEQKLQQLHQKGFFKWRPEMEMGKRVKEIEKILLRWGEEDPDVKLLSVLFLGYITMKGTPRESDAISYGKAKEYIDKAVLLSENNKSCLFLAHSLLAHWHDCLGEQDEFEVHFTKTQYLLEIIRNEPREKAWLFTAKGFALLQAGPTKFDTVVKLFDKATERNPEEPLFYYLNALTLGRKRRYLHERSVPTDDEISCLETACNKTNNKNLDYLSTYCFCLAENWSAEFCKTKNNDTFSEKQKEKIKAFLKDAGEESNAYVLLQCAKSYRLLKDYQKQRQFLEKANEISNGTYSAVLHRLGLYFWRNKIDRNMENAKEYLKKSFSVNTGGNIFAEVDYLKLLKEEEEIDSKQYLTELSNMLERSTLTDINKAYLYMCKGEEMMVKKNVSGAKRCFWEAIILDPELCDVRNAKTKLLDILEQNISKNPQDAATLCELGRLYERLKPQDITKAIDHYKQVLSLNSDNEEANLGLCRVLLAKHDDKKLLLSECSEIHERLSRFKDNSEFRKLSGKCLYFWGSLLLPDHTEDAKKKLTESVKLGCMNSCKPLLSLLNKLDYTESAVILNCSSNEEAYWLSYQCEITKDEIERNVKKSLLIEDSLCSTNNSSQEMNKVRKLRLEMEQAAVSQSYYQEKASEILIETKSLLDRTMNRFQEIIYKGTHEKKSTYFPYLQPPKVTNHPSGSEQDLINSPKATNHPSGSEQDLINSPKATNHPSGSEQDLINCKLEMKSKFEKTLKHWKRQPPGKGEVESFSKEFGDLFEILCKHQAVYDERYYFVPKWMEIRNKQTHEKINNQNEFTLKNGTTVKLLDLARKAHEYTENMVKEFNSGLPP